jgi:hypothetical protein
MMNDLTNKTDAADETMDRALVELRGTATEMVGGITPNHGPMVAEALIAMGRPDAVAPWVRHYRARLAPAPQRASAPVKDAAWREALGDAGRSSDWAALFLSAIERDGWRTTVDAWVPRLLPGIMAGGAHGLIRCGHAVRSLQMCATRPRIEELATALAYWAADWRELPGSPNLAGELDFEPALARMPRLPMTGARPGVPREFVWHVVDRSNEFARVVASAKGHAEPLDTLAALERLAARTYLANAGSQPLVFLHGITAAAALELLVPYLDAAAVAAAMGRMWQANVAWFAAYADTAPGERWDDNEGAEIGAITLAELVDRAVRSDDAHAIKLTEACARLSRTHGDHVFLRVADDWCRRVEAARDWTKARRVAAGMSFERS